METYFLIKYYMECYCTPVLFWDTLLCKIYIPDCHLWTSRETLSLKTYIPTLGHPGKLCLYRHIINQLLSLVKAERKWDIKEMKWDTYVPHFCFRFLYQISIYFRQYHTITIPRMHPYRLIRRSYK